MLNSIQDVHFRGCSQMGGICHNDETWHVIPHLKKILKIYKSHDTLLDFC